MFAACPSACSRSLRWYFCTLASFFVPFPPVFTSPIPPSLSALPPGAVTPIALLSLHTYSPLSLSPSSSPHRAPSFSLSLMVSMSSPLSSLARQGQGSDLSKTLGSCRAGKPSLRSALSAIDLSESGIATFCKQGLSVSFGARLLCSSTATVFRFQARAVTFRRDFARGELGSVAARFLRC